MVKKHGLNQLQIVTMDFNRQDNEPFWVKFSNGKQTKRLIEGQDAKGSLVLKNSIVKELDFWYGFDAFVELLQKIIKHVGHKVPIVKLIYSTKDGDEPNQDLMRFCEHYAGTKFIL